MVGPDPVDVRLLTAVAESGRAAVHEIAAKLGMDVREVAARLAVLSTTGLPLIVGVECDPTGIRKALAAASAWTSQHSGAHSVQNPASGGYQVPAPNTGGYPMRPHSGAHPVSTPPQSGNYQVPTPPSTPQGFPQQAPVQQPQPPVGPPDPMRTWGPPGSASWARADQQAAPQQPGPSGGRVGKIGSKLEVSGLEGEVITIQLVEVVDPADFLFTAAGYQLRDGERSVVVHTEVTNRGTTPFSSLPDLYLVLVADDGSTISKAPVSLSSRPPHRIGVAPGETMGGHTVYVLSDSTELIAVRWTPRPGDDQRTLNWDITEL